MKQSPLPGLEVPAQPDIEDAAQTLRDAKDAAKRAAEAAKQAEATLINRMIGAKVQKHRYHHNDQYIDVEVTLPSPSVRVRIAGDSGDER